MTNTLHRYGDAESFRDDFIVFAIPSRGKNDANSVAKLKKFLEMAVPFNPVNLGDARHGGALRPCKSLNPGVHWKRDNHPEFFNVIEGLDTPTTAAAVFDNSIAAENFVRAVVDADLGLSVNISTSTENAERCCAAAGICRHSVGYSLVSPSACRTRTFSHCRPCAAWHDQRLVRQEDDRLGEGGPPHARAGGVLSDSLLLLRGIQPVARETNPGRSQDADEVARYRSMLAHKPSSREFRGWNRTRAADVYATLWMCFAWRRPGKPSMR
jgi:hypothetical protein